MVGNKEDPPESSVAWVGILNLRPASIGACLAVKVGLPVVGGMNDSVSGMYEQSCVRDTEHDINTCPMRACLQGHHWLVYCILDIIFNIG